MNKSSIFADSRSNKKMQFSNYDKSPSINVDGEVIKGWETICSQLKNQIKSFGERRSIIVFELYTGVHYQEILEGIQSLNPALIIESGKAFYKAEEIERLTYPYVTEDELFGYMTALKMEDFLDQKSVKSLQDEIESVLEGVVVVIGPGAALVAGDYDLLVYADMARWEIEGRMKRVEVHGLGVDDSKLPFSHQYKRGYFVDWRVCDRLKKELFHKMDYVLDTNQKGNPKMIRAEVMFRALKKASLQPFRVVPYFDPGPWGGQWMKEVCDLDKNEVNFAWCFDCVPEENSLLLNVSGEIVEIPSINLVFLESRNLLGQPVETRFGQEFPIRFDFLDTMSGGNLSLQVHPDTAYIREKFGMNYTQDESYYLLDAKEDATVFLGVKTGIPPDDMMDALNKAQNGGNPFDADHFINRFPACKHDHFLIPAGTVHCSGTNCMVLEISATPYIFTFKMWDWERFGLDGKPRPINITHAEKVIQWERDTTYVRENLLNCIIPIAGGDGWREESTGLHHTEFIETRRHWFSKKVYHQTFGSVNVINLIEGREAIVESMNNEFEPFVVHYAETFIVPAAVKEYTIQPFGASEGKEIATIKAFVRV
jgi:mannose-6-phosphate isomerase class I